MSYIITIQYPYQYLEMSISYNSSILQTVIVPKIQAVGLIIPTMQQLLKNHNLTLSDIACIGVNTGPGPFNTLRAIIATANGIAFAQKIPLVACNGLELLLEENGSELNQVAVLDAFGTDVYYAIKSSGLQGYMPITDLIHMINTSHQNQAVTFIGNGSVKHQDYILQNFTGTTYINHELLFATSKILVATTYKKFNGNLTESEIFPLYFASPVTKS